MGASREGSLCGCCASGTSAGDAAAAKLPLWRMLVFGLPGIPAHLMKYVRGTLISVFYANVVGVSLFDIAIARFFAGECPTSEAALRK